jgi:ribosomal protein S18 acetylase RimI-like enzyme
VSTTVQVMSLHEVEPCADQLLSLLDRALAASPLATQRTFLLEHLDGRLRNAASYGRQLVVVAQTPEQRLTGFALGEVGGDRARLPGDVEERAPGFAADALFVWWIVVEPRERRNRIGVRLLDGLVLASGSPRAWLRVHRDNRAAMAFYRSQSWLALGDDGQDRIFGFDRYPLATSPAAPARSRP